jgi:hypothetical protein
MALLFVISKLILAIIHHCSRRVVANQRESSTIAEAIIYSMMFIPFSLFAVIKYQVKRIYHISVVLEMSCSVMFHSDS